MRSQLFHRRICNDLGRRTKSRRRPRAGNATRSAVIGLVLFGGLSLAMLLVDAKPTPRSSSASTTTNAVTGTATTATTAPLDPTRLMEIVAAPEPPAERGPAPLVTFRGTEGFWRVAEDAAGVWWFVSPDGEREFLNTVTTVQPFQTGRRSRGPHYISRDWDGSLEHFDDGDTTTWAIATLARVREAGFKGLGAWSHLAFHDEAINPDVPVTRDLNVWTYMTGDARRFYSPEFAVTADRVIKQQVEPLKQSKTLVGYFTDNELDWSDRGSGPSVYFDHLDPADPNRVVVTETIRQLWPTVNAFNADWQTEIASFDELDAWTQLPNRQPAYTTLYLAFVERLAADYFELTGNLVRKYDPNHLVLGVRYKGHTIPEVVRGQRDHTDVVSLNYYVADGKLDRPMFEMIHAETDLPMMIGEYSFHALDGRSGNRNTFGFLAQVLDQQARADGYRLMTQRLAGVPYVVGADWFQWNDEPPSGRVMDGEDVNFGVVDVDDHAYEQLVAAILETTPRLNEVHAGSGAGRGPASVVAAGMGLSDVWRMDFESVLPEASLPHLARVPRIDGSLRDWDDAHELLGIKRSGTLGADRRLAGVPTVYAGWTEAGLYFAIEVPDDDIQAADAEGSWWTQDALELWISTRPDAARPRDGYSVHDHQFFFVPNPFPQQGHSGTWGQWSRPGDALEGQHQIPHPLLQDASRILPGRYVAELFIPAETFLDFEPAAGDTLRFNLHVRDYQTATDFFWSAPKEAATQHRPRTWGLLKLDPTPTVTGE